MHRRLVVVLPEQRGAADEVVAEAYNPHKALMQTLTLAGSRAARLVVVLPEQRGAADEVVAEAERAVDRRARAHGAVVPAVLHGQPDPCARQPCALTKSGRTPHDLAKHLLLHYSTPLTLACAQGTVERRHGADQQTP